MISASSASRKLWSAGSRASSLMPERLYPSAPELRRTERVLPYRLHRMNGIPHLRACKERRQQVGRIALCHLGSASSASAFAAQALDHQVAVMHHDRRRRHADTSAITSTSSPGVAIMASCPFADNTNDD